MRSMVPAPVYVPHGDAVIDNEEVQNILPHRFPFLMVDRIVGFEGETKCTGIKCVTINEPFFQGHFPGHPIMPGVLQLEAMAQVASVLLLRMPGNQGKIGYFLSANAVKWRKPVRPGDVLRMEVEVARARGDVVKFIGRGMVGEKLAAQAEFAAMLVDTRK